MSHNSQNNAISSNRLMDCGTAGGNYETGTVTISKDEIICMLQQIDGIRRKLKSKLNEAS